MLHDIRSPPLAEQSDTEGEAVPPSRFGLEDTDAEYMMQTACTALIEQRVRTGDDADESTAEPFCQALLVIFTTHMCLELNALNFTSARVISFEDVLGIEQDDSGQLPMIVVSCQEGLTVHMTIARDIVGQVAKELELARLENYDLSRITDGTLLHRSIIRGSSPNPIHKFPLCHPCRRR